MNFKENNNTTKEKVIKLLEKNAGNPISGSFIAENLHISRTAVWKGINSLKEQGYKIEAVSGKGYTLKTNTDVLSLRGIKKYLNKNDSLLICDAINKGENLQVFDSVTSTNDLLKEEAVKGATEGTAFFAAQQTVGKGRSGRNFYSPKDTGLYLSILLRPNTSGTHGSRITTIAAVAVCKALEEFSTEKPEIKWVNDIYIKGKKVCGILTEATSNLETGNLDSVIVGVGLNIYPPKDGFPKEIRNRAGSVLNTKETTTDFRNKVAASIYSNLFKLYKKVLYKDVAREYKERCFILGKEIEVLSINGNRNAKALDLDEECRLKVRYENGEEDMLFAGEISIKPKKM